jgi:hypothetical protein
MTISRHQFPLQPKLRLAASVALVAALLSASSSLLASSASTAAAAANAATSGTLKATAIVSPSAHWYAINDSNEVAGFAYTGSTIQSPTKGIRWDNGVTTSLVTSAPDTEGGAFAIDSAGVAFGGVAGYPSTGYPVMWSSAGTLTKLTAAGGLMNALSDRVFSTSDNGNVVGLMNNAATHNIPGWFYALAPEYTVIPLGVDAGSGTVAINDAGDIAVGNTTAPYLQVKGAHRTLKVSITTGFDLNNNGDVAGALVPAPSSGSAAAIELANGTLQDLPPLHPGDSVTVNALNDHDEAVGTDDDSQGNQTAVAWINGKVLSVGSLVSGNFSTPLEQALDVNNNGSILAQSASGDYYLLGAPAAAPTSIVVNTTSDENIDEKALSPDSGAPFCAIDAKADDRQCSLRAAIELANKLGGTQSISFDIPGSGVPTISPASALPAITASVTLDATTQAGGWVELSGANAGSGDGLSLEGANSTVRGLVINGFSGGAGIKLAQGNGDNIVGDRIGTDPSGMTAVPNKYGLYVDAPGATIGGTTGTSATSCTGDCNLLSGNTEAQVYGESKSGTDIPYGALKVQGDWIGADATGDAALPGSYGVKLGGNDKTFIPPSDAVIIGGDTPRPGVAPGNLIVSSGGRGVEVEGLAAMGQGGIGATISGNLIGLSPSGQAALGRGLDGISADGQIMIGGTEKGDANVVSGFQYDGIFAENSQVIGNLVGTNIDGTAAIGNLVGVEERFDTVDDNVISGNSTGVTGSEYVTLGYGNIIGLNKDGTAAVPNGVGVSSGLIMAGVPKVTFPGVTCPTSPCNVISGNKNAGIESDTSQFIDIQGAYIGTDITGKIAIPNGTGILLSDVTRAPELTLSDLLKGILETIVGANNVLGIEEAGDLHEPPTLRLGGSSNVAQSGACSFPCNIVAGNTGDGVFLQSYVGLANLANRTSYVEGNLIGVGADGAPLPNGGPGIVITGVPDTEQMNIGGSAETGNAFAGSSSTAISVTRKTGEIETAPVRMIGNIFHMVGSAAPIYRPMNPTPPRLFDVVQVAGNVAVKGQISAREFFGHTQTLEIYASPSCVGTLRSVGLFPITNQGGDFDVTVPKSVLTSDKFISALVTDGEGVTSKFPALDPLPWAADLGC